MLAIRSMPSTSTHTCSSKGTRDMCTLPAQCLGPKATQDKCHMVSTCRSSTQDPTQGKHRTPPTTDRAMHSIQGMGRPQHKLRLPSLSLLQPPPTLSLALCL